VISFRRLLTGAIAPLVILTAPLGAQRPTPVTRADAVASTVTRGARLALARADTAVAGALLKSARMFQNPALAAAYSKATPNYHVTLEIPLDVLTSRGSRIGSARAGALAAQHRFAFERAASMLDADTTYTRVLAARERLELSRRNALDADSLRGMAATRRSAGDASDLDVELATVAAGQAANVATGDSLTYLSAVLDLQTVMGLSDDRVTIHPTDSLGSAPPLDSADSSLASGAPLQIAAAEAALEAARLATRAQRRSVFGTPALIAGFETGDPTGSEPGTLPTFGVALPFPLFNLNRGPVRLAEAAQERARAELALVQAITKADIARTRRELTIAQAKLTRDRTLVASASRVVAMSLTAYREGAAALPNVLEAQRNAREVLSQYVDDLASAWIAAAELRVLTLTPARAP
jgi:cobalt-zinc-cadmium efflux system outer membrane protein